jgi:hypothetical protein
MASKQLVTISGAVEQVNAKGTGIKVLGEWLNVSQYHPINPMPTSGELVEVVVETTDRGQWINSLKILGAAPAGSTPAQAVDRDARIMRQVAMKCSVELIVGFAAALPPDKTPKVDHVFPLADRILHWLAQSDTKVGDANE